MNIRQVQPHKSSIGDMNANIMAFLVYIIAIVISFIPVVTYVSWLVPLIIFLIEKKSSFVKFHAMQSLLLYAVATVISIIFAIITAIITAGALAAAASGNFTGAFGGAVAIGIIALIIGIIFAVLGILSMIFAFQYKQFKIPVIGNIAENAANKPM